MGNNVILVDDNDNKIGIYDKIKAHEKNLMHRAFSIFIFNQEGEMLIQQRAEGKYHGGGKWSNACCGHPVKEDLNSEAVKRLNEEMGFECELKEMFTFVYNARLENGLYENEYDHVLLGFYSNEVKPNREEVRDYRWINVDELDEEIKMYPDRFTYWFRLIWVKHKNNLLLFTKKR